MRINTVGAKAEKVVLTVRNGETSTTIPAGTPVCYSMNRTNDGLDVVLPATGGAAKATSLLAGVTLTALTAGQVGDAMAYGYIPSVVLVRATRAASSNSWTSSGSIQSYATMSVDTVNNGFLADSAGTGAASGYLPHALIVQSVAALVASATATSDTRTVITTTVKAFVRML